MRAARDRRMLAAKRPRTGDEHERVVARSQVVARRFRTIFCRSHSNTRCVTHSLTISGGRVGALASSTPGYTHSPRADRPAADAVAADRTRRTGTRAQPQGQATGMRHRTAWSAPSDVRAGTSCKCNGSSGGLARRSTNLGRRTANAPGAQPALSPRTARAPPGPAHRPGAARTGAVTGAAVPRSAFSITAGGIAGLHRVAVVRDASRVCSARPAPDRPTGRLDRSACARPRARARPGTRPRRGAPGPPCRRARGEPWWRPSQPQVPACVAGPPAPGAARGCRAVRRYVYGRIPRF